MYEYIIKIIRYNKNGKSLENDNYVSLYAIVKNLQECSTAKAFIIS